MAGIMRLAPTPANPLAAMSQGFQVGQQMKAAQRKNALAELYQQQGTGLVSGDSGAINALAAMDPAEASKYADRAGAAKKAQRDATMEQTGIIAGAIYNADTPEKFEAAKTSLMGMGLLDAGQAQQYQFESRDALIGAVRGLEGNISDDRDRRDFDAGMQKWMASHGLAVRGADRADAKFDHAVQTDARDFNRTLQRDERKDFVDDRGFAAGRDDERYSRQTNERDFGYKQSRDVVDDGFTRQRIEQGDRGLDQGDRRIANQASQFDVQQGFRESEAARQQGNADRNFGLAEQKANTPDLSPRAKLALDANIAPGTPEWTEFLTKSTAPSVTVNSGASETAFDKEFGKIQAKEYGEIRTVARGTYEMDGNLSLVENAIDEGLYTGVGAGINNMANRIGAAFGVDGAQEKAARGELVTAVANNMALFVRNPDNGGGMPGATSERDVKFLLDSVPGMSRTPEGNKAVIGIFRAINQRRRKVAELADEWMQTPDANGQRRLLDSRFNSYIMDNLKTESDIIREGVSGGVQSDPYAVQGGQSAPARLRFNPETGEIE